jgi:hypothetical protein
LPQLGERRSGLPGVKSPEPLEQVVHLILEGKLGEQTDGVGVPQPLFQ